jgi:hypothetical protein
MLSKWCWLGKNPKMIHSIMRNSVTTLAVEMYRHPFSAAESDAMAQIGQRHLG